MRAQAQGSRMGAVSPLPVTFPLAMRVVVSWTLGAAVVSGGFFVSFLMLGNQLSPSHMFPVGAVFFGVGAGAGLVHGGLLAYLGRRLDRPRREGLTVVTWGAVAALIALVPTAVLGMWIALAPATLATGGLMADVVVIVSWILGLTLCAWGVVDGWAALQNLVKRWPESRVGAPVLIAIFGVALVAFLLQRPEIWGTDIRVTGAGAVILAVGATLWIASPVVVLILHVVHRFSHAPFEASTHPHA